MAETQKFICPGRYFGRYCSDEREYEYARILEIANEHALKVLDSIKSCEESEAYIEVDKWLEKIKEQKLVD